MTLRGLLIITLIFFANTACIRTDQQPAYVVGYTAYQPARSPYYDAYMAPYAAPQPVAYGYYGYGRHQPYYVQPRPVYQNSYMFSYHHLVHGPAYFAPQFHGHHGRQGYGHAHGHGHR